MIMTTFFKPVWKKLTAGLNLRIGRSEDRLSAIEQKLATKDAEILSIQNAWNENISSFLNAVGTVSAISHQVVRFKTETERRLLELASVEPEVIRRLDGLVSGQAVIPDLETRLDHSDGSITALWERIEFVRREILFELQHGTGPTNPSGSKSAPASINHPEKVELAKQTNKIRLNLGCGHIPLPDYINVDRRNLSGVDIVSEVGELPFEPSSLSEIFSAHLLEHFPQEALRRRLLPRWFDLLMPGGLFAAVTPDASEMLSAAARGDYGFEDFREVLFGAQDYEGDFHFNLFTSESLTKLLHETGFVDIETPVAARRNGKCFEFEIRARKP